MTLIDRYIIREISRPMLVVCAVLIAIFAGYTATRYLADATAGILPARTVLYLVLLRIVIALEVLLPVTLYLSIIVGLGRLHADNEMTAMISCGISSQRIYRDILTYALVISIMVAGLSLYVRPWAYQLSYRLKMIAKANFQVSRMDPKAFYELDNGRRVIFARRVDHRRNRVEKVFIRTTQENSQQIITAREAFQKQGRKGHDILVFRDGNIYNLDRRERGDTMIAFRQYILALTPPEVSTSEKIKAAATVSLLGSDIPVVVAERQWRFSTPFTAILLALLGIPLSQTTPRRGRYGKVILAIALYGLFYGLSLAVKTWVAEGDINPFPGIWLVQLAMVFTLLVMAFRPTGGGR